MAPRRWLFGSVPRRRAGWRTTAPGLAVVGELSGRGGVKGRPCCQLGYSILLGISWFRPAAETLLKGLSGEAFFPWDRLPAPCCSRRDRPR